MGNFNRGGGGFGGKKRFDNDRGGFRGGDRSDRPTMHQAICADCGRECSVPFKPTGDKPVFCSNCFGKKEGSNSRFESRRDTRPSFGDKQMFQAICDKCHKECEVPFKPSGDKPIFCNNCFGKADKGGAKNSSGSESYQKQFEMLNTKLDSILKLLSPQTSSDKVAKEVKPTIKLETKTKPKKVLAPKKAAKKTFSKKKK